MRGLLTPATKVLAEATLGKPITQEELRLMPYLQYVLMNGQELDPRKINSEETDILVDWEKHGFITMNASFQVTCTKEFWVSMCEILWLAYVKKEDN